MAITNLIELLCNYKIKINQIMKKFLSILFVIFTCQLLVAQPASDVLMTIEDEVIGSDEFLRIYNKNSSITLEEKKSVEE